MAKKITIQTDEYNFELTYFSNTSERNFTFYLKIHKKLFQSLLLIYLFYYLTTNLQLLF